MTTIPLLLAALLSAPSQAAAPETDLSLGLARAREAAAPALAGLKEKDRSPREFVLRVLSYNIYGIPLLKGGTEPPDRHDRYRDIGRALAALRAQGRAPHIVALQEAFHPRTEELPAEAGYPYRVDGAPERRPGLLNSGLILLSEFPLEAKATINFKDCMGMDCYANKGVVRARVRVPGLPVPLELFNTHMNADVDGPTPPPEETMRIRIAQIGQALDFMRREIAPEAPALFPGDFNFKPAGADYRLFTGFPGIADAAEVCSRGGCAGDPDPGAIWRDSVDHQFLVPGKVAVTPIRVEQTFKDPINGQRPSDHLGLEAWYRLTW